MTKHNEFSKKDRDTIDFYKNIIKDDILESGLFLNNYRKFFDTLHEKLKNRNLNLDIINYNQEAYLRDPHMLNAFANSEANKTRDPLYIKAIAEVAIENGYSSEDVTSFMREAYTTQLDLVKCKEIYHLEPNEIKFLELKKNIITHATKNGYFTPYPETPKSFLKRAIDRKFVTLPPHRSN